MTTNSFQLKGPLRPDQINGPVDISPIGLSSVRGCIDLADSQIAAGQVLTDDNLVKISNNAKFSVVRCETIFMGFYKHGDTVQPPLSPIDGYQYDSTEVFYDFAVYSNRAPGVGFVSGQTAVPAIATSQPTNLYWYSADIDDASGLVAMNVSYFQHGKIAETITHDGIVKVYATCQRQSVNVPS